jgi:hypothetical protein
VPKRSFTLPKPKSPKTKQHGWHTDAVFCRQNFQQFQTRAQFVDSAAQHGTGHQKSCCPEIAEALFFVIYFVGRELYFWDKFIKQCMTEFMAHRKAQSDIGSVLLQPHYEAVPEFSPHGLKRPFARQIVLEVNLPNVSVG